jgi:hypothetical protein
MEKTNKKFIGGLIVVMLIATSGAVFVIAQTNVTSGDTLQQKTSWERHMNGPAPFCFNNTMNVTMRQRPFWGRQQMNGSMPSCFNLTEEQQTELNELISSLKDQVANSSVIQTAIRGKLDEFGVFDTQLDNEINQTERQLQILNREKELRNEGKSWDEIRSILQNEFDLQVPADGGQGMMFGHGFGRGSCGGPHGFMSGKDSK